MSDEELKETKKIEDILTARNEEVSKEKPKNRAGRKPGSKNKELVAPKKNDEVVLLIEEVKALRDELTKTKEEIKQKQNQPVAVRLESKKKRFNFPPYSGPMKKIKFMRNEQQDSPMPVYFSQAVFNEEKGVKELLDWRPKNEDGTNSKGLKSGEIYEVPEPVVGFLNSRSEPLYGERPDPNNPQQTRTVIVGQKNHCYCIPM